MEAVHSFDVDRCELTVNGRATRLYQRSPTKIRGLRRTPRLAAVVSALRVAAKDGPIRRAGGEWFIATRDGVSEVHDFVPDALRPRRMSRGGTLSAILWHLVQRDRGAPISVKEAKRFVLPLLAMLDPEFNLSVPGLGPQMTWDLSSLDGCFDCALMYNRDWEYSTFSLAEVINWAMFALIPCGITPEDSWMRLKEIGEAVCDVLGVPIVEPVILPEWPNLTPLKFEIMTVVAQAGRFLSGKEIERRIRPGLSSGSSVREALSELKNDDGLLRARGCGKRARGYALIAATHSPA